MMNNQPHNLIYHKGTSKWQQIAIFASAFFMYTSDRDSYYLPGRLNHIVK